MAETIEIFNGPIAVLDFLGFKTFVENNPLQDVINTYGHEITAAEHSSKVLKEDLQFMVYSDTIAIRLVNQTDEGFLNFIKALQLIASGFFVKAQVPELKLIPLRGAISLGEYSWHNGDITTEFYDRPSLSASKVNFIVGQAIIDAHEHEKIQQWIGISMNEHTSKIASERFPEAWSHLLKERYLIEYNIPIKSSTVKGYVVNPTVRPVFKKSFEIFLNKCDEIFKREEENYTTKLKYYNTLKLLNDIHSKDELCPYFHALSAEQRKGIVKKIDKTKYRELIKYFEEKQETWQTTK